MSGDIGLVLWIGRLLAEAGCQTMPAMSCRQALSFSSELDLDLDFVVVNPSLPGVSSMLRKLRATSPRLNVVSLPSSGFSELDGCFADLQMGTEEPVA